MYHYEADLLTEEELDIEDLLKYGKRTEAKIDLEELLLEMSDGDESTAAIYHSLILQLQIDYREKYLASEKRSEIIAFLKRKYDPELQDKTLQILNLQFNAKGYDPNPWINSID